MGLEVRHGGHDQEALRCLLTMRFIGTFKAPKFDTAGYRSAVDQHMRGILAEAARRWLGATVATLIPVWSGASAATFSKLANAVNFPLPIVPVGGAPDRRGLGTSQSDGGLQTSARAAQYFFFYRTDLEHLAANERTRVPNLRRPGPYSFVAAGQRAFREFAATVRLPNPYRFITTANVTIG